MLPRSVSISSDALRTLHRIHRQLTDLRDRLDRGPRQVRARAANVQHQEELHAKIQAEAKAHRVATEGKQLQLKSKEERVKELKSKLNQASSNREYQALKEQIAADEMANSVLADEILEAMEKSDDYKAQVAEAAGNVTKAREELHRLEKEVAERGPLIQGDLVRLEGALKEAEDSLPPEIRDVYQRVVRSKGEEALAPVVGDEPKFCGGCNQVLPLNQFNAMRLNKPIFCRSCGRLLYLAEGDEVKSQA